MSEAALSVKRALCPCCKETIKGDALECKHCGASLTAGVYTVQEILVIAKKQKVLIWFVVASVVTWAAPAVGQIVVGLIGLVFVYQLASALKSSVAWLFALLMIIPAVNTIILLVLNSKATKALRSAHVRVGWLGAISSDLSDLIRAAPNLPVEGNTPAVPAIGPKVEAWRNYIIALDHENRLTELKRLEETNPAFHQQVAQALLRFTQ